MPKISRSDDYLTALPFEVEYKKMFAKIDKMTRKELESTWEALRRYDPAEFYAPGISMDTWAQAIYSEMDKRGIPHIQKRTKTNA